MLKVSVHTGDLELRTLANQVAVLDIAYAKQEAVADYMVALSLQRSGEMAPAKVAAYPRWSASLWDLVARALAQALYRTDTPPRSDKADRRCAYATRLCAVIERATANSRGVELGTMQLTQTGQRGHYRAVFREDILGERSGEFDYGCKDLNPAELLMRAICWALFGSDVPGPKPKLIIPPVLSIDGVDRFHIAALDEPARTGFQRYLAVRSHPDADCAMPAAADYVRFLMKG